MLPAVGESLLVIIPLRTSPVTGARPVEAHANSPRPTIAVATPVAVLRVAEVVVTPVVALREAGVLAEAEAIRVAVQVPEVDRAEVGAEASHTRGHTRFPNGFMFKGPRLFRG